MRLVTAIFIALSLYMMSGCAVFNRNNTPATNYVEAHFASENQTVRVLSYPLVVPAGIIAAAMDMLLFHPISVAKDSWEDTNELLWKNLEWDNQYVTTTVVHAPRIAAIPIVFTADLIARSNFDISRRGGEITLNKNGHH